MAGGTVRDVSAGAGNTVSLHAVPSVTHSSSTPSPTSQSSSLSSDDVGQPAGQPAQRDGKRLTAGETSCLDFLVIGCSRPLRLIRVNGLRLLSVKTTDNATN